MEEIQRTPERVVIQKSEKKLKDSRKTELVRRRTISLRFSDYAAQSGRGKNIKGRMNPVIRDHAKSYKKELIKNNVLSKILIKKILSSSDEHLASDLGKVINFYINSQIMTHRKMALPHRQFFYFIEHYLNFMEEKFCLDYKYDCYKDVYVPDRVKIKPGVYRFERISALHEGKHISVSKLTIRKCVDVIGKNVFNEAGRERWGFIEEKSASKDGKGYESINTGRIVIRNDDNYIFMGVATHTKKSKKTKEDTSKNFQLMNLRLIEDELMGIVFDTSGGTATVPFAARARAIFIADTDENLEDKEFKSRALYIDEDAENLECVKNLIDKNDAFFIKKISKISGARGFIAAF